MPVMDLADDIAYSCFDIVDGAKARFLTPDTVKAWRDEGTRSSTTGQSEAISTSCWR